MTSKLSLLLLCISFIIGCSTQTNRQSASSSHDKGYLAQHMQGFCEGKTLNPCSGQNGKPYRKYACFEFNDGVITAYKSETSFKQYNGFKSVTDFMDKNGITKQCGSAQPITNQVQTDTIPPVIVPPKQHPKPVHGNNGSLPIEQDSFSYYYAQFSPESWKKRSLSSDQVKKNLQTVLTSAHIQVKNKPDQLVAACSQNNEQQEGVCVAQKRYNYSNARKYLFGQLHLKYTKSGLPKVEDVYCNRYITKDDYSKHITRLPGPMKIPDHEVINCEHTWPKSKFSDQERDTQLTDLHHLFPTDTKVNRIRSNYQFGEVDESKGLKGERHEKCQEYFKRGIALQVEGIENTGKTDFFEPPNYHKGNVARALFYMSVRYNNPIGDLEEYYLRKWHVEDPVDEAELKRNHGIYLLQGIRNPFIDYPELVEQISDF